MTDGERQIWRAAYAAAFVAEFERLFRAANHDRPRALNACNAMVATAVADEAVRKLRKWREEESPAAGVVVPKRDEEP